MGEGECCIYREALVRMKCGCRRQMAFFSTRCIVHRTLQLDLGGIPRHPVLNRISQEGKVQSKGRVLCEKICRVWKLIVYYISEFLSDVLQATMGSTLMKSEKLYSPFDSDITLLCVEEQSSPLSMNWMTLPTSKTGSIHRLCPPRRTHAQRSPIAPHFLLPKLFLNVLLE